MTSKDAVVSIAAAPESGGEVAADRDEEPWEQPVKSCRETLEPGQGNDQGQRQVGGQQQEIDGSTSTHTSIPRDVVHTSECDQGESSQQPRQQATKSANHEEKGALEQGNTAVVQAQQHEQQQQQQQQLKQQQLEQGQGQGQEALSTQATTQDCQPNNGAPQSGQDQADGTTSAPIVDRTASGTSSRLQHRRNSSSGSAPSFMIPVRDPMEAPVRKLTVNLIRTYKYINQVYYENKRRRQAAEAANAALNTTRAAQHVTYGASGTAGGIANATSLPAQAQGQGQGQGQGQSTQTQHQATQPVSHDAKVQSGKRGLHNNGHDDENSDYIIQIGERIQNRYVVKQKIGKGSFGQVVCAFDERKNENVAIKIIKSRLPFFQQAKTEISLLKELNREDPEDKWFIVRLLDTFVHHNHQCIVFEMLSYNLYDLLRNTAFFGVSLNLVRKFARQILKALYFLSRARTDVIHCDLKPENILLRHPKRSAIKLIDFGSSCKSDKQMYSYLQSRFYRSPEIIFGRPYSVAIDMWSLGCILVEMHTGEPLFSGSDEYDQVLRLVAILGMPPDDMIASSSKSAQFFERKSQEDLEHETTASPFYGSVYKIISKRTGLSAEEEVAQNTRTIPEILGMKGNGPAYRRRQEKGHTPEVYELFVELVESMLKYDPQARIRPKAALSHPFLSDQMNAVAVQSSEASSRAPVMTEGALANQMQPTTSAVARGSNSTDHSGSHQSLLQRTRAVPPAAESHQSMAFASAHAKAVPSQQHFSNGMKNNKPLGNGLGSSSSSSSSISKNTSNGNVGSNSKQGTAAAGHAYFTRRPGSAPATATGGGSNLRRSSRVAKQQQQQHHQQQQQQTKL